MTESKKKNENKDGISDKRNSQNPTNKSTDEIMKKNATKESKSTTKGMYTYTSIFLYM
jgi:hypothetical protein